MTEPVNPPQEYARAVTIEEVAYQTGLSRGFIRKCCMKHGAPHLRLSIPLDENNPDGPKIRKVFVNVEKFRAWMRQRQYP